uniref:Uncharacterized protein n=1 Tax=viral metagenome TaxID=1070528 RepID=A0A6C0I3P1_9ZZZZ
MSRSSSADVPLIPRSPPPSSRSTMSLPPSPRNTIQALRYEAANDYKCRGCISRCLPCVDTPEQHIQKQLAEASNREFQIAQTMRNDPDRIEREKILLNLQQLGRQLKILNQNPLDNEKQITLLNEEIRQLKEELELLKNFIDHKKLREDHRNTASVEGAFRTLSDIGGTINRKTRKYKKNNKKYKSKNRRSKYLKNIKRNRRTYKHRN